jgi:hypothetical protein
MTSPAVDIVEACADPELFGGWFRDPATWRGWFCFLRTLFSLPMGEADWALFRQSTGREDRPTGGFREAWLVVGRRGGKSIVLALIALFLATFIDWTPYHSPRERGTVMVIATDRRQARVIFRYVQAFLSRVPMLAALIERETADAIDLSNGVTIEILTANFRIVRGTRALSRRLVASSAEPRAGGATVSITPPAQVVMMISRTALLRPSCWSARRVPRWSSATRFCAGLRSRTHGACEREQFSDRLMVAGAPEPCDAMRLSDRENPSCQTHQEGRRTSS